MLKEIGPPWSWLHQFASSNCRDKSYNFLEGQSINSDETPSETSDESFDFDREKFKSPVNDKIIKGTDLINWSEIFEKIVTAECNHEISVKDSASVLSFIEKEEQENSIDCGRLKLFVEVADEHGLNFHDLNELCEYFEENNLPSKDENKQEAEEEELVEEEEISKNIIETTFIESGIEVDDALLKKQISDKMILGVIEKSSDDCLKKKIIEIPSTPEIIETDHSNIEITSENSNQTLFSDISSKVDETNIENRLKIKRCKTSARDEILKIKNPKKFSCVVQPIPGIGKIIIEKRVQDFLTYLKVRSKEQNGMIFPRNFQEDKCPNMIDSNEN